MDNENIENQEIYEEINSNEIEESNEIISIDYSDILSDINNKLDNFNSLIFMIIFIILIDFVYKKVKGWLS